jgi:ABC-type glutathione transport system ATPase component
MNIQVVIIMLELYEVKKLFPRVSSVIQRQDDQQGLVWAVDNVSLSIQQGNTIGLIGESGCGKTTIGKIIMRLVRGIDSGRVSFRGRDIFKYSRRELHEYRKRVQMIFQSPDATLNPYMSIGNSIKEAIQLNYKDISKAQIKDTIKAYLRKVDLSVEYIDCYPDELSGGEKRRIGIIRAMAVEPELIVADEPFSGVDVHTRNHLVVLFNELQEHAGVTFIIISHDMDVLKYLCSIVVVMYLGRFVEIIPVEKMTLDNVRHPYTRGLLLAAEYDTSVSIGWEAAQQIDRTGCLFRNRCFLYDSFPRHKKLICIERRPLLIPAGDNHSVSCHFWHEI